MALPTLQFKDGAGVNQFAPAHLLTTTAGTAAAAGTYTPTVSTDGGSQTYFGAFVDLAPVATPTAYALLQGSSTKTIRVRSIRVVGSATAFGEMTIKIARWSTAGTIGSAVLTTVASAKADSANDAATAVFGTVGTANWTTEGTQTVVSYGVLDFGPLTTAATSSACPVFERFFGRGGEQALVLRGTSAYLAIGGDGDAVPSGGVVKCEICWVEESEA